MKNLMIPLFCLVLLSLSSAAVSASPFNLDIDVSSVSTCPTVLQGVPPLDKHDIPIIISNQLHYPDTYTLELDMPDGWSGHAFLGSSVDSGESKTVDAIWITVPETPAGSYPVTVTATSGMTTETQSGTFQVNVLSCHAVELDIEGVSRQVCSEDSSETFNVKVKNDGRADETFTLSVKENGQPVDYAGFGEPTMTLSPGETRNTGLEFNFPVGMAGKKNFIVTAGSESSYAVDSQAITLDILDCYSFSAGLHPKEAEVCIGKGGYFTLSIKNTGKTDTYRITGPAWMELETDYISIKEGSEEFVRVLGTPGTIGTKDFGLAVSSVKEPASVALKGSMDVIECRDVAVIVSPAKRITCEGYDAEFTVSVKNLGTVEDTFELLSSIGSLSDTKAVLGSGRTRFVKLVVNTRGMKEGEHPIKITARSDGAFDETEAVLQLEVCYSGILVIEPEEASVCPCESMPFKVMLRNTGQLSDEYLVKFGTFSRSVRLDPGKSTLFDFEYRLPCDMAGGYDIMFSATSEEVGLEAAARVHVKPIEECWSARLEGSAHLVLEQDNTLALPIKLVNTGDRPATYSLSASGPEWVYLQPDSVELNTGEEAEVFIYLSPPEGTLFGDYPTEIKALSDHALSSMELNIHFVENASDYTSPEGLVGGVNETEGAVITGHIFEIVPVWKTMAVGIITIIIVLILVFRFAFLVKA